MNKTTAIAALVCVAVCAAEAPAQTDTAAGAGVYTAEVTGQNVYVRSGPSSSAYYCVELSKPAKVTVVSKSGTWLKILPPAGCYSVVDTKSVRLSADGKTGRIVGERVWARAGGFPTEPGEYSMLQKAMKADERVVVLGQTGDYHKIVPPAGAYFWIEAKSVKRVGAAATTTTKPAPATRPAPTTRPAVPKVVYKPHPDVIALKALDKEVSLECKKPFKDRDYEALLAKFKALKPDKESGVGPYVEARIKGLEIEIERQKSAEAAAKLADQAAKDHQAFEIAQAKIGTGSTTRPIGVFTAKGIVTPSALFTEGAPDGKRFVLRDAQAVRINAYLVNTDGQVALDQYAGKLVEVYGKTAFDRDLSMDLVDVQKVVVVSEDAVLPGPPAPAVRPPETKPEPKKTKASGT